ncbi:MAG: YbaB/EbfC family nucleoid-associated protein [Acidobacteriota bacterium]|nr:YbaB/EbfC family nucleoid-associated protein [Acidobacteriota bacterium]MDH3784876.1 YbaB/EbfC family nucleoid-associated protein [Acidobacteriota bacterium]
MNLGKMMKDLQAMQTRLQTEIETLEVEGAAGGGMVTASVNGKKELLTLKISRDAIDPSEPDLLEDLVVAAVNEAGRKVDDEVASLTRGMAPGLNLPGMG